MTAIYKNRCSALQITLASHEAVLLSNITDIAYFTGFFSLLPSERECFLVLTAKEIILLYAAFCPIKKQPGMQYIPHSSLLALEEQTRSLQKAGIHRILVDDHSLCVAELESIQKINGLSIGKFDREKVWQLRRVKDTTERAAITEAAELTKQAYEAAKLALKPGVTELDIALTIEFFIKKNGGELAFPIIVAFGKHAALPHHQPTTTPLEPETVVLIDLGAKVNGYCADMTRTEWFGKRPSKLFSHIFELVTSAYQAAKKACSNSELVLARDVDLAARSVIEQAGYGNQFIHTTGHGLGLDIHESPSLYKNQTTPLLPETIITIEPGIYLPEKFGVRYENTLVVTKNTVVELTT